MFKAALKFGDSQAKLYSCNCFCVETHPREEEEQKITTVWIILMKRQFYAVNYNPYSTRTHLNRVVRSSLINPKPVCLAIAVLNKNLFLEEVWQPQKCPKYLTPWESHIYTCSWCPSLSRFCELRAVQEAKSTLHDFCSLNLGILLQNQNWNHQFHLSSWGDCMV